MPTIEYKIRKLAEILEEQHGIYLDDFTLSEEAWGKWLEEHNAIEPSSAFFIAVGGRKIRVNLRGANDYSEPPGQVAPVAPGYPPGNVPVPAITPQVPMTPPGTSLQEHIDQHLEQQQRQAQLQVKNIGGWPEGQPLGIEGCIAQDLGGANEQFNAGKANASTNEVD